ncbi:MAG: DUF1284 domain-containing protein [Firmicutes bacterium]|nr:DUF1284 domain-containing protein [Bacillota bacterium]
MIRLRGHHLLCLLGYRGMGYSEDYVANMTRVHRQLRTTPSTPVQIIDGPDDLCACFPAYAPYHCQDDDVWERDRQVLAGLGLTVDEVVPWNDIVHRIRRAIRGDDLVTLCSTCSWLSYGVCVEGVEAVRAGRDLPVVD